MQQKPAFQMLWFVSIVFSAFNKYFIVRGVLFCFVLCVGVRYGIVDATSGDNVLVLCMFLQQTLARTRVTCTVKMYINIRNVCFKRAVKSKCC